MPHLISFTTSQFDPARETPNPINPIYGQGVLQWVREELVKTGWDVTTPDPEDWGWYMLARRADLTYLVGASGEPENESGPVDWIIQIHKQRTLWQKLTGKNKLQENDPLSLEIQALIRGNPAFMKIVVEKQE